MFCLLLAAASSSDDDDDDVSALSNAVFDSVATSFFDLLFWSN